MASDEAKRLRAEVQRRIKSVNSKIARTKRTSGANIEGTQFDPRRKSGIEQRYNAKQLKGYLENLNSFMRRSNQFVAGVKGAPIERGKFNLYKQTEAEINRAAELHAASVGHLETPTGFTVQQSKNLVVESYASPVYGPYRKYDREPGQIKDASALEELTNDLNKKLRSDYLGEKISEGRENLEKALTAMGENELQQGVDRLSDYQFDALWFGTNFAEATFLKYQAEKDRLAGTRKEKWQDRMIDSAYSELGSLLDWAGTKVPTERPN
jgi:hypothetical protein